MKSENHQYLPCQTNQTARQHRGYISDADDGFRDYFRAEGCDRSNEQEANGKCHKQRQHRHKEEFHQIRYEF